MLPGSLPVSHGPSPLRYSSGTKPPNCVGLVQEDTRRSGLQRTLAERDAAGTQGLPSRHLHQRRGGTIWSLGEPIQPETSACWQSQVHPSPEAGARKPDAHLRFPTSRLTRSAPGGAQRPAGWGWGSCCDAAPRLAPPRARCPGDQVTRSSRRSRQP